MSHTRKENSHREHNETLKNRYKRHQSSIKEGIIRKNQNKPLPQSTKTRLAPQTNGDAMTSTWLGKSRELYEILTGGQLHCANVSPASPRPSLNKTIHKERKGA